jgi:hypothetical protein
VKDLRVVLEKNLPMQDRSESLVTFKESKNRPDLFLLKVKIKLFISRFNLFNEKIKVTQVYSDSVSHNYGNVEIKIGDLLLRHCKENAVMPLI